MKPGQKEPRVDHAVFLGRSRAEPGAICGATFHTVKAERPSQTANFVALGRAMADVGLSHVANFHDPAARVFLSEKAKRSLAKTEQAIREGKRGVRVEMASVSADMIALRTAAIDRAVADCRVR